MIPDKPRYTNEESLLIELKSLIEKGKLETISYANSTLTCIFWSIGKRIRAFINESGNLGYGKKVVVNLSIQLTESYGRSFEEKNLRRMIQFSEIYPDFENVVTLSRQLSWSHFVVLLPIKSDQERSFYANLTSTEHLSVRSLRKMIEKKTFHRAAIADMQLPKSEPNIHGHFKDPYLLDFLKVDQGFLESDLENAVLGKLEHFILELGKGFAFVERQKRMIIDGEDYYLDLLFYNRNLRRLVAIELKIGKFKAKYKGQMELYLKWLNKFEKRPEEESPLGLILCAEKSREQIELLEMHKDGILVAEYWTELLPRKELEIRIQQAFREASDHLSTNRQLK
ncbi:MAG TPA: PDDEXK nuclease domain-containing protein [Bacteroidales bacterium]|nr:PDDEXK nuclease domain-containing protein [Bacteroidales bacterium]HRZ48209.1 PDDEXK nuclease domain-containing protein [Bacteroidales bacterium]